METLLTFAGSFVTPQSAAVLALACSISCFKKDQRFLSAWFAALVLYNVVAAYGDVRGSKTYTIEPGQQVCFMRAAN